MSARRSLPLAAAALIVACKGAAPQPSTTPPAADADAQTAAAPSAAPVAPARPVLDDAFAALLDERAAALLDKAAPQLASFGTPRTRTAVMMRVIWQTVAAERASRIEAMAILLPDGRLRWAVLAVIRRPDSVEVTTGLAYPEGVLAEGVRRPLAAVDAGCTLPMIPLADVATLPERIRDDTFSGGYGLANTCAAAAAAAGAAWVVSLDWFGAILTSGDRTVFVSSVPRVDGATLNLGEVVLMPMALGTRAIVDAAGAPMCDTGRACFDLGERANLTGERDLRDRGYGRACDLGHGLSCIHLATLADDAQRPDDATALRTRSVPAFRTACDAGDGLECAYLGIAHEQGSGTARDEKAAFGAYTKACSLDNALGCFNLGGLYREGRGVKRDVKRARTSYQRACDLGDGGGCDAVESLGP